MGSSGEHGGGGSPKGRRGSSNTATFALTRGPTEEPPGGDARSGEASPGDADSADAHSAVTESGGSIGERAMALAAASAMVRGSPTAADRRAAKQRELTHQTLLEPLPFEVMSRVLDGRGMKDVDTIRQLRFQNRLTPNLYEAHQEREFRGGEGRGEWQGTGAAPPSSLP